MKASPWIPADSAAGWVARQLLMAWRREGEPDQGFPLTRHIAVLCGVLSLLLLAVATVTVLSLDTLWRFHEAAGFVLLPVVAVKLAPIGVRAARYYGGAVLRRPRGRDPGVAITPPVLIARLTAAPLAAALALLLASGIVMWQSGDQRSTWSTVHNASAIVLGGLIAVHLACHARSTLALGVRRLVVPGERRTGGRVPPALVAAALVAGIVLAVLTVPAASWQPGHRGRERGFLPPGVIQSANPPVVVAR
jgi:hypothetical protein